MAETKQKVKRLVCRHEWVFDTKTRLAVSPSIVKGVCKKCGKQIVLTREAYEATYAKHEEK